MVLNNHLREALGNDAVQQLFHNCTSSSSRPKHQVLSAFEDAKPDDKDAGAEAPKEGGEKAAAKGAAEGDKGEKKVVDPMAAIVNDPNDPSTWTEKYKLQSPPVKEAFEQMQQNIQDATSDWRRGFIKLDESYEQVHDLNGQRMKKWEQYKNKLQSSCERLRDALDGLYEAKGMCAMMQDQELPTLFKVKGNEPKRFKRFGKIKGCVRQDPETGLFTPAECECIAGNEMAGCVDSVGSMGNTLSCTHILEKELPNLPMGSYFEAGGACRINSDDPWNLPIISKDKFEKDFKRAAQAAVHPLAALAVPASSEERHRHSASSKSRSWDAFLVDASEK